MQIHLCCLIYAFRFCSFKYHESFYKWTHFQQEIVVCINHKAHWKARLHFCHTFLKRISNFSIAEEITYFLFMNVMKLEFHIGNWTIFVCIKTSESWMRWAHTGIFGILCVISHKYQRQNSYGLTMIIGVLVSSELLLLLRFQVNSQGSHGMWNKFRDFMLSCIEANNNHLTIFIRGIISI